jgi:hypothetical protein
MMPTRKTVSLNSDLISILDKRKTNDNQSYGDVIFSALKSPTQTQPQNSSVPGVGAGQDAFNLYAHNLGWVTDTAKKLILSDSSGEHTIDPSMREQAYDIEPLVSGIICPFLKNVILSDYSIETKDNKKYAKMIEEIEQFIEHIKLMEVYRDDFEDLAIKHGHSYRRKDYDGNNLDRLQRLEARAMKTYQDPFNDIYVAYHQRIYASDVWSSNTTTTNQEINSWWVPNGLVIDEDNGIYEDGAKEVWEYYQKRYSITETARLRVGDSGDVIAMHFRRPGKPAPIDAIMQVIWEKRLTMANLPNVILSVLYPFIQIKQGVMLEALDENGVKKLITSVPQPASSLDTEKNAQEAANYSAYTNALKTNAENLVKYRMEGGTFATGPDVELKVIESASAIAPAFISTIFKIYNEEIGQGLGFPVQLVTANGSELATSRTIKELFNTTYAGVTYTYETTGDCIIEEAFAGKSWDYEIEDKYSEVEKGKFTFEETGAEFILNKGDIADNLKIAQTQLIQFQTLQAAKALGATKADIQAQMATWDMEGWDLENYDSQPQNDNPFGTMPSGAPALPSDLKPPRIAEQIQSSVTGITKEKFDITEPEVIPKKQDKKLQDELMDAWKVAEEAFKEVDYTQSISCVKDIEVNTMNNEIHSANDCHDDKGQFCGGSGGSGSGIGVVAKLNTDQRIAVKDVASNWGKDKIYDYKTDVNVNGTEMKYAILHKEKLKKGISKKTYDAHKDEIDEIFDKTAPKINLPEPRLKDSRFTQDTAKVNKIMANRKALEQRINFDEDN